MRSILLTLCLLSATTSALLAKGSSPDLAPCKVAGTDARCGVLEVPENPDAPDGRQLRLRVAVLPALDSNNRLPDPLLILEGGPGASVLSAAPMHVSTFARVLKQRDLVFIEQRGTGESNGLDCGLGANDLMQPAKVRQCRESLSKTADLSFYGTSHTVGDLAAALDQLGYQQANVFGVSYGTRTALELTRRYPDRVRTVSLLGTYPPGRNGVLDAPSILDRSLQILVDACGADEACNVAYPMLSTSLEQLSRRLDDEGPKGFSDQRLDIASTLRLMLFYPLTARQVPKVLTAAAQG